MKKVLMLSALVAMLLVSGCSQKNQGAGANGGRESADASLNDVATAGARGSDNFVSLDERTAAIKAIEDKLQSVYFDFDKYGIRADMQGTVDTDAKVLAAEAGDFTIKIEGNCDEYGTDEYNYALGLKRAVSVKDALSAKGISEAKMLLVSYGESKPVCMDKTKECFAKNRRADFKLLP